MLSVDNINLADYTYILPENRIASFPSENRDSSMLLVCKEDGGICHDQFRNISHYLNEGSHLVFNNSRVIPARLIFTIPSGSRIELFCLTPLEPAGYEQSLSSTLSCDWECMVGNLKRFRERSLQMNLEIDNKTVILKAEKRKQKENIVYIHFSWEDQAISFARILSSAGKVPLPPYIKREPVESDRERYQTIYSKYEGSVAAPTAGLHFTEDIITELRRKNISTYEVTLHVGAGTFQPIKGSSLLGHEMHSEFIRVQPDFISALAGMKEPVVAVGTTTVRTLESLYWLGVKAMYHEKFPGIELSLEQWEAYELPQDAEPVAAFRALQQLLVRKGMHSMIGSTRLMIIPGYRFRVVDTLITNFHQPGSTLLLLVAAFMGNGWKTAYRYALDNDFRFLSYGDSSIIFRPGLRTIKKRETG